MVLWCEGKLSSSDILFNSRKTSNGALYAEEENKNEITSTILKCYKINQTHLVI